MTEINRNAPVHQVQHAKTEPNRDQFSSSSRDNTTKHNQDSSNARKGAGEDSNRSKSSLFVSQSAFQEKLTGARDENNSDNGDEGGRSGDDAQTTIILASLEPSKLSDTARTQAINATSSASQQSNVDEIVKLVTNKLETALRPGPTLPPNPLKISLPLDAASTGLSGVNITLTNDTLTVTLQRATDAVMDMDEVAALNLAQALQARFPKKAVQVLEASAGDLPAETDNAKDQTMSGNRVNSLTSLFHQPDDPR